MHKLSSLRIARLLGLVGLVTFLMVGCGGGSSAPVASEELPQQEPEPQPTPVVPLTAEVVPGNTPYAVEARVQVPDLGEMDAMAFTVRSKPGRRAKDVRVTWSRSHLESKQAIDTQDGSVAMTVFGLYGGHANEVVLEARYKDGTSKTLEVTVETEPQLDVSYSFLQVVQADDRLGASFVLLQGMGPTVIVDVDGEVRWRTPSGIWTFSRIARPWGLVATSMFNGNVYNIDWLGRVEQTVMSDARCTDSHHNLQQGKTGILNTVGFEDGPIVRPESVLAEMDDDGTVNRLWDMDDIFRDRIEAHGEDASTFVNDGVDWFHMNSAIYCAADDSILLSSRENGVVKIDYETGEIRWILGSALKQWYTDHPASLQPLALSVVGLPPVGQHALSVSEDGTHVLMFDNGNGNAVLEEVGDTRGYSRVVEYRIDELTMTAEEVWTFDFGQTLFCPFMSAAYRTQAGNVIAACVGPIDSPEDRIYVVNPAKEVLFEATVNPERGGYLYAANDIGLEDLTID